VAMETSESSGSGREKLWTRGHLETGALAVAVDTACHWALC
jgi:hypothetical protein